MWSFAINFPEQIENQTFTKQGFQVFESALDASGNPVKSSKISEMEEEVIQNQKSTFIYKFFKETQRIKVEISQVWEPIHP